MDIFLMLAGIVVIVIAVIGAVCVGHEIDEHTDGTYLVAVALICALAIAFGLSLCFGAIDTAGSKIESKTVIIPDTLVVSKNGVADTTYIYNRPKKD